jgi:Ca-activated chloride channel family protein
VANPVLADVKIKIVGLETYDVYPKELPDIFKGSQIAVVGRYKGGGHKAVRLTGKVGKKEKEFVYETDFPEKAQDASYVARVWATSKVGYLLDEMRLHGESSEVRKEVVRLAKEFGILTPYTSYLVVEDTRRRVAANRRWRRGGGAGPRPEEPAAPAEEELERKLRDAEGALGKRAEAEKEDSGAGAVEASKLARRMKSAPGGVPPTAAGGSGHGWGRFSGQLAADKKQLAQAKEKLDEIIRKVGAKTFYLSDSVWYDAKYKKDMEETNIKYLSDEYFELLKKHPEAAKYFAIAAKVVVVLDGKAYRIIEE